MRAVLYTQDMEPITIIDLPYEVHNFEFDVYRVPYFRPLEPIAYQDNSSIKIEYEPLLNVYIHIEKMHRNGKIYPFFFVETQSEELALLLKPEYLPGQLNDMRRKQRDAFISGIIQGFKNQL